MRRGTWILALSSALALKAGGALAVEPTSAPPTGRSPAATNSKAPVSTRYSRAADSSPAAAAPKNFYDQLFAEPGARTPAGAPAAPASPAPAAAGRPTATFSAGKMQAKRPESAPPAKQIPLDDSKVFPASAEAGAKDAGKVIHATYDKSPGADSTYIQQIRATSEKPAAKSPAPAPATPARAADQGAQTPMVTIEWARRSDINVGQECQLELIVKNSGSVPAKQVAVEAAFPSSVRLTSAEPKPASAAEKLTWNFDSLAPGAERKVAIKLIPSRRGDLGATAEVRFTGQAAAVFKVEEPLLKVAIKGPEEVMVGDPASQIVAISNPGTGVAHDVKLEAKIPEGLEHPKGERLQIEIGSINPGETRQVRLGLSAIKGGTHTIQVAATSSTEASSAASAQVKVIAPSLKVAMDGPGLRYKGRHAKYTVVVTNDGSIANNNVRASQTVPEGFQFVSAEKGGKYDAAHKEVHWFVGRLEPGQSAQLNCELAATSLGEFALKSSVQSDAGVFAEARTSTRVEGTASLATEIVDLDDPVEIGSETAWEVRIRNEGSKASSNIAVACELPAGVDLLNAKGPTEAVAEKRMILFKSLGQLAPGQQAVYRIHVKGAAEGVHRLRARVTSDSLDEPLILEEATKFYADARN